MANATTVESLLEELKAQREFAEARAAEDAERIRGLEQQVSLLIDELRHMRQARFGRSSERIDPGQLSMYDEGESAPAVASEPVRIPAHDRRAKKPGHGRSAFPEHLPREVVELDVPAGERFCPDCGEEMHSIGVDCSEVARFVPAKLVVTRYERKKYACRAGHGVVTADKPAGVVDRGKYDASVYAHIATAKYSDHLPLHRQEGIWKRYGLKLAKQTMWDLLVRLDELIAQPILAQMRQELRAEPVLHADETPITLRPEQGKGTKQGWIWLWRSLSRPGPPKAMVEFLESRGRDGPLSFLRGVSPVLIVDGYSGYDAAVGQNEIIRAGCWSHARRYVKEALDSDSKRALQLLVPIQRLFWIERAILRRAETRDLEHEQLVDLRRVVRERHSRALVARIVETAEQLELDRGVLPKSKLGKAIGYLLRQRKPLAVHLDDPRLPIHNNDAERDLRHIAVGRKNWQVFASPKGGEVGCRLFSLVLSAKLAGINVEAYLHDVLARVDTTPASEIASLTPWAWAAAQRG